MIFDVDGTLIDTNAAHVDAWLKAMGGYGYHVSPDRIATEIGKGGDKLVPSILGEQINRRDGKALGKAHDEEFTRIARSTHLPLFPGVEALLTNLRHRGMKTALATSSQRDGFETAQQSAGIDLTKWVDEVVTAEDAPESKPAPHLVAAAMRKLKLSPAQCAMVGDTPYDIDASRDSGGICIGLLCGKLNDEKALRATGARAIYQDPADLLSHLDEALQIASPGAAHWTEARMESLMREALAVARDGMDHGEAPIGCVLARGDGTIIARGYNELNRSQNKTSHAEMVAFARAAGKVPPEARDLILVSTLEPCVMCLGASMEAAVDTILYGLKAPADGGTGRIRPPLSPESQMPRIVGAVLADESRRLFKEYLRRGPGSSQQEAFTRQLLEMT